MPSSFEKSLKRKTFKSWAIPSEFKRRYEIVDGQVLRFKVRLNNSQLVTKTFRVTSGGELYLPADFQRKVENQQGVLEFTLLD